MIQKSQIIDSYRKYGFDYRKTYSNSAFLTFTIKQGFFHNAEILIVDENNSDIKELDDIKSQLNKLDISAKDITYIDLNSIQENLFNGFFDVDSWRERILNEYDLYTETVLKSIKVDDSDVKYSYVNAPYTIVNTNEEVDNSIIDNIISKLDSDKAELILVEAPAGFGKTSTSYEIIKKLTEDKTKPIPFFTEFSRDRQARIFSHVFIREVDRAFSQVKSNVVQDELKDGRIVLVLDGFDELLSDTDNNQDTIKDEDYENAEPMLQTISELLLGKAKIIITSRRSAIFDGATFNDWLETCHERFVFNRYRITSPEINDWLVPDRYNSLEKTGIKLKKISNPVLLSYLRVLSDDQFEIQCEKPNEIIDFYFEKMLERERDRQNLMLNSDEQSEILTKLAADMCDKNYTSESKEKIIKFMKSNCSELLEKSRRDYLSSNRPTIDALCNTLSNHAFFDRSNQGEDRIEFINEFVFGNFIANEIKRVGKDWIAYDERFVEPAIVSYEARSKIERKKLWCSLETVRAFLKDSDRMKFEAKMLDGFFSDSYSETSIMSIELSDVSIFDNINVSDITFSDCVFKNIKFSRKNLKRATFISCKFYDCSFFDVDDFTLNISVLNCIANNDFIEKLDDTIMIESDEHDETDLKKAILSRFWKIGSDAIDRVHINLAGVYKALQYQGYNKRDITREIQILKKSGLLADAAETQFIAINTQKMGEITRILGK